MPGTTVRIGGVHRGIGITSVKDASEILSSVAHANLRWLRDDPEGLRDDAIRRVYSPPCATRCRVSRDGSAHDCNCASGFQWSTDPEAQALEGCPARDVWNDLPSLYHGHRMAGRGKNDPIVADCDCLTPASLAVAAYLAWFAPERMSIEGVTHRGRPVNLGAMRNDEWRGAVAIALPPDEPGKERVGHAFGLVGRPPREPQPTIRIRGADGRSWYVWDASCHWGMGRPKDSFYTTGEVVGFELRRENLDGLQFTM